ncbi:MAG: hypothetical protein JNJ46_05590 [Myxococcales bacterium]|nr:hypothetical protein [Myxococcales bacterium]
MDFAFIVVGAGLSGLCLARLIVRSELADKRLLVIDGAEDDEALRTLSFWSDAPSVFDDLVRHEWSTLSLQGDAAGEAVTQTLGRHRYRTLFFADLQRAVRAEVQAQPGCQVLAGRVREVTSQGDCAEVEVGEQRFRARYVFDSRFSLSSLTVDTRRFHFLRQHFCGWIVQTPEPTFDPLRVLLFDFRTGHTGLAAGESFFYLLPLSDRRALVELVTLSAVDAPQALEHYLREVLGLREYAIEARERGISPLTEQPFSVQPAPRVRRIGIAAGRIKPSTGYALSRIEEDSRAIVQSLVQHGHPHVQPRRRPFYAFADGVMLELWQNNPGRVPAIFRQLFRKNPADRVLAFLDERLRLGSLLLLIASLPFAPFLCACLTWILRRLGLRRPAPNTEPT